MFSTFNFDMILTYVFVGLFVGVIIAVILVLAKKQNKNFDEEVLPNQPKQVLENLKYSEVVGVAGKNAWTQKAYIYEVNDKGGKKIALKLIYFNTVLLNGGRFDNAFASADVKIRREDFEGYHLAVGSFVRMYIEPEKIDCVKIVF